MIPFSTYSLYYDLLYSDKNYQAEADYILSLLLRYNPNAKSILELGSGSGTHAGYLCGKGKMVTGIERSEQMLDISKNKQINGFTPLLGDIANYDIPQRFDAAISLFHVISYLTDNTQLVQCLNTTNRHLNPGGLLIFDCWYSPAVYRKQPEQRTKQMENHLIKVERKAIPEIDINSNTVTVHFDINIHHKKSGKNEQLSEVHPMRHFSIPEIALLAEYTGFKILCAEEFLTSKTPGEDTWGICFVLQKQQSSLL